MEHPSVSFFIIRLMPESVADQFAVSIASEAVEISEDHLLFELHLIDKTDKESLGMIY